MRPACCRGETAMCFLIWEMPQVSGWSAGFYLAIHRITDGFGLAGTLRSISWACFSWGGLLGTTTFFSIGKIQSPTKCFLLQGCVAHFLFLLSVISPWLSSLLSMHTHLWVHWRFLAVQQRQQNFGPNWISKLFPQVPATFLPSPSFMGKPSVTPTQGTAGFSSAPLLHRRMAVCCTIQLFHWKNNKAAEE